MRITLLEMTCELDSIRASWNFLLQSQPSMGGSVPLLQVASVQAALTGCV